MLSNRKFGAFSASDNPDQLGSTVKAFILGASVLIISFMQWVFHVSWTAADVNTLATEGGALVTALWVAYGIIKKFIVWLILRFHTKTI